MIARDTRDTMPSFAEREAARRYLAEISTLLHDRSGAPGRRVFKRLHQTQVTPGITEKLRGIQVVLEAIASGKRTSLNRRGLANGCDTVLAEARKSRERPARYGRKFSLVALHATLAVGGLLFAIALGLRDALLFPLVSLIWIGYVYWIAASKVLPYLHSSRPPARGIMNTQTRWFRKAAVAFVLIAAAVILGITLGVGGVIFTAVIGIALALRAKLRHAKPPPLPEASPEEINPATGSPMMHGGLIDARGNPWGMRNRD